MNRIMFVVLFILALAFSAKGQTADTLFVHFQPWKYSVEATHQPVNGWEQFDAFISASQADQYDLRIISTADRQVKAFDKRGEKFDPALQPILNDKFAQRRAAGAVNRSGRDIPVQYAEVASADERGLFVIRTPRVQEVKILVVETIHFTVDTVSMGYDETRELLPLLEIHTNNNTRPATSTDNIFFSISEDIATVSQNGQIKPINEFGGMITVYAHLSSKPLASINEGGQASQATTTRLVVNINPKPQPIVTNNLTDYMDAYTGVRRVGLKDGPKFDVGFIGVDVKIFGPVGVFGEIGTGKDMLYRPDFELPIRSEYKSAGLRVTHDGKFLKLPFTAQLAGMIIGVNDAIRLTDPNTAIRAGQNFQSIDYLKGLNLKISLGPLFIDGGYFWDGDGIGMDNIPRKYSGYSIAGGLSLQGLYKTLKR